MKGNVNEKGSEDKKLETYQPISTGSLKNKPNCLCHIYLMPDHIILKLSRYLENSTNNKIPTHHNILFNG